MTVDADGTGYMISGTSNLYGVVLESGASVTAASLTLAKVLMY